MTTLINLFGASSAGKSTLMADLFTSLKQHGFTVEMCPEIIKKWAWDGVKPNKYDQYFLMGQEIKQQSRLFHKVDFILSDSPVIQNAFYNWYLYGEDNLFQPATDYLRMATDDGIKIINYMLVRNTDFESQGRYQTEEQADEIALALIDYVEKHGFCYPLVKGQWHQRVLHILEDLNIISSYCKG